MRLNNILLEKEKFPLITVSEKKLTILIAKDGKRYCAFCPELDLVAELDTLPETVQDIIEAIRDYAREYLENISLYSKSPNRAHHLPCIKDIASCKDDWELMNFIEVRYGRLQL